MVTASGGLFFWHLRCAGGCGNGNIQSLLKCSLLWLKPESSNTHSPGRKPHGIQPFHPRYQAHMLALNVPAFLPSQCGQTAFRSKRIWPSSASLALANHVKEAVEGVRFNWHWRAPDFSSSLNIHPKAVGRKWLKRRFGMGKSTSGLLICLLPVFLNTALSF